MFDYFLSFKIKNILIYSFLFIHRTLEAYNREVALLHQSMKNATLEIFGPDDADENNNNKSDYGYQQNHHLYQQYGEDFIPIHANSQNYADNTLRVSVDNYG